MGKRIIKIANLVLIAVITIVLAVGTTYAWFKLKDNTINNGASKGSVVKQYFHTGDGSEEDPFVITRPIHYYHLVELYQRNSEFAGADYHFQLGYDLDGDGELEVYAYDSEGKTDGSTSKVLNMAYYSNDYSVIPIGTSETAFNGTFNGNDLTIDNLNIVSYETIGERTYSSADVGVFGYLGNDANIHNLYISNLTIDLNGIDKTKAVESDDHGYAHTDKAYVGYIAGHIVSSAQVQDVYVNSCSIQGGAVATCNFGFFGLVDNGDGTEAKTLGSEIATIRTAGDEAGFGGSIDMDGIYERLDGMMNSTATRVRLITAETIIYDEVNDVQISREVTARQTSNATADGNSTYYYQDDTNGSYYMFQRSSYIYLYGESTREASKTITTYTYKNQYEDGYLIFKGTNYLGLNGINIANVEEEDATSWVLDAQGHLYTYVVDATVKRYLNANGTTGLTFGTTASTVWTYDDYFKDFYMVSNGNRYFINYATNWGLTATTDSVTISDGTNYLVGSSTGLSNTTVAGNATGWVYDDNNNIYVFTNGSKYYLNGAANVSISTTNANTVWTYSDNALSYTYGGQTYKLVYNGASWTSSTADSYTTIYDNNNHYLAVNGTNLAVGTQATAGKWNYNGSNGTISISINGTTYYLAGTTSLSLSPSTQTVWTYANGKFSYTYGGNTYYLTYVNNAWGLALAESNYVFGNGTYYLVASNTGLGQTTSIQSATHWTYNGTNGVINTYYNNNVYYLNKDGAFSTTSDNTSWVYSDNKLYYVNNSKTYYLFYENSWVVTDQIYNYSFNDNNGHYLVGEPTGVSNGSAAQATKWTYNGTNGTMSTIIGGTTYYLGRNASMSTTSDGTNWVYSGNRLSYTYNSTTYYLCYINNSWTVSEFETFYKFNNGSGVYLNASTTGLIAGTQANATEWYYNTSTGVICTKINGAIYYLNRNGALSTTSQNVSWNISDSNMSYVYNFETYYLVVVDGAWTVSRYPYYYIIGDGSGNYMQVSGTSVTNTTNQANATKWIYNGNGPIFTTVNDQTRYLRTDCTVGNNPNVTWVYSEANHTISYTANSTTYYLGFDGVNWSVGLTRQVYKISDGTHYLNFNNGAIATGSSSETATEWSKNANNNYFYVSNGTAYYLNGDGSVSVETTNRNTAWTLVNNKFQYTYNNQTYNLTYDNGWKAIIPSVRYKISDNRGHYLAASGTTLSSVSNVNDATIWTYNGTSGTISYVSNNTTYYLIGNASNNAKVTLATSNGSNWSFQNNKLYVGQNYNLLYNNGYWIVSNINQYTISSGSNYMSASNGTSFSNATSSNAASLWNVSNPSGNSTFSTSYNGTTYNLRVTGKGNTAKIEISTGNATSFTKNGSQYHQTTGNGNNKRDLYIYYNNNSWGYNVNSGTNLTITQVQSNCTLTSVTTSATNTTLISRNVIPSATATRYDLSTAVTKAFDNYNLRINEVANEYDLTLNMTSVTEELAMNISNDTFSINVTENSATLPIRKASQAQVITKDIENNVPSAFPTYIPIRTAVSGDKDYDGDNLQPSYKNTGYIISGGNFYNAGASGTKVADIRVSQYGISSNIGNSYSTTDRKFTSVYTYNDSGRVEIVDDHEDYPTYETARDNFYETIAGETNVSGLHFMNAEISKSKLVVAESVSLFGKTYYDYELPQDSIDFNVVTRGSISFFAGTYFSGNNAFFSLHQIVRDNNKHITAIKEIAEVYQHKTLGVNKPYIYRYTDDTYSATVTSDYESVFKTAWITNPASVATDRVYYFEIPVNAGEYALGSVSGKTGAYLMYLDIGTNGGAAVETTVSSEGNTVANAYKCDFRSSPDTSNHSLLQLGFDAPEGATSENFKVTVSFDDSATTTSNPDYVNGLYTITVLNKTGKNVELMVLLIDDDFDASTEYYYAYKVIYINNSTNASGVTMSPVEGYDYYKSVNGFIIPTTGEADEMSFSNN